MCNVMMSEQEIATGCKRGIASAQRAFFDIYSPHLMAVIFRYVGNEDDAKDVLQDSYVSAFGSIHRFKWEGNGSLKAWITRIAVNTAINHLRDNKRLTASQVPVESLGEAEPEIDEPGGAEVDTIDTPSLMRLIAQLPDGYRTVFNLYCIEGLSHKQIAEQLGINEKSSTSQLSRAKALLSRKIKEHINARSHNNEKQNKL